MRPSLFLDGLAAPSLERDLIAIEITDRSDGTACSVTLANWSDAAGAPGYAHFDAALGIGHAWRVVLGDDLTFTGSIAAIDARYPGDAPPSLVLHAAGVLEPTTAAGAAHLHLGATLRACVVRTTRDSADGGTTMFAEGTAEFHPGLRAGADLELAALGTANDGAYAIFEARHRYDAAGGPRSEFSASRHAWVA